MRGVVRNRDQEGVGGEGVNEVFEKKVILELVNQFGRWEIELTRPKPRPWR